MKFRVEANCKKRRGYLTREKQNGLREGFTVASSKIPVKLDFLNRMVVIL